MRIWTLLHIVWIAFIFWIIVHKYAQCTQCEKWIFLRHWFYMESNIQKTKCFFTLWIVVLPAEQSQKNLHFLFIFAHTLKMIVWWPFLTFFDVNYVFYKTVRALFFMSNLRRFLSIFSPWIKCQICHRHENTLELNTKSSELDTLHVLDPFETVSRSYLNYFAAPNIQTPDVMKRKRLFLSSFGTSKKSTTTIKCHFCKTQ